MADIRHIMHAATSHEFGTIPGRYGVTPYYNPVNIVPPRKANDRRSLPIPTAGEYMAMRSRRWSDPQNATPRPRLRLHVRRVGNVGAGQYMTQWCVEDRATKLRTAWQFHVVDAYELARQGHFKFQLSARTL